jgi:hypothetical protein
MSDEYVERELRSLPTDDVRWAGLLGLAARAADARRARAAQDGFVDWSQVRADDLELPEDDDLGVHTCVHATPCRPGRPMPCRRAPTRRHA